MMRSKNHSNNIISNQNTLVSNSKNKMERNPHNCRRKLQEKFDECDIQQTSTPNTERNRNIFANIKLQDTRKVLRDGIDKISKTFTYVKTSFDSFSQRFRISTKRRQILEENCMTPNCATPQTFSRRILGRTPTKLYSPFSIESPYNTTVISNKGIK